MSRFGDFFKTLAKVLPLAIVLALFICSLSVAGVCYDITEDDFEGWENHIASRRLEADSLSVDQAAFTRPAAFAAWRSVYWLKPDPGAARISVTAKSSHNIIFKQDGIIKSAISDNGAFIASFELENGKAMTEIEVVITDGKSARSYYLDVCAQDPQGHDLVADYYDLPAYPKSKSTTQVLVDQITGGYNVTLPRIDFVANYLAGSQKNIKELILPVKALNPAWHSLHYHLSIWNGPASIIIDNAWTDREWHYLQDQLFAEDPFIFMYAVNKNSGKTTWLQDITYDSYLMNISNETYYQYLLDSLEYQCQSTGYDSIFLDSFALGTVYSFTNYNYLRFGGAADGGYSDVPYDFITYQHPQLAGLSWLQASEEFISRLNKDLNKRGIWLLPNLGNMQTSWDPLDYALSNGGMLEAVPMRPDNSRNIGDYYYLYDWVQSLSRTMYLTQKDRVIILQPYLADKNNLNYRLFVIGEYLLVKGDYTFINLCMSGQAQASWYPEYEIDLGAPKETHLIPDTLFTPWKDSIDKALLNYQEGNLFIRRFEKGIVILNPHRSAQQYILPADRQYRMAVISGGGTVPETGIGDLAYSLDWLDLPAGSIRTLAAESALILRFEPEAFIVSGKIKSYDPNKTTTIRLLNPEGDIAYTETLEGIGGYSPLEQEFIIPDVAPGIYDLVITKDAHTKFTVKNVTISNEDLDLTKDIRPEVQLMSLRCGDISNDGLINDADLTILWRAGNYNKKAVDAENSRCDLNGDGLINDADLTILWLAYNYNRGAIVIE